MANATPRVERNIIDATDVQDLIAMEHYGQSRSPATVEDEPDLAFSSGSDQGEDARDIESLSPPVRRRNVPDEVIQASFSMSRLPLTAEEVLEASLSYRRIPSPGTDIDGDMELYPSADTIETSLEDDLLDEIQSEIPHGIAEPVQTTEHDRNASSNHAGHVDPGSVHGQMVAVQTVEEETTTTPTNLVHVETVENDDTESNIQDAVLATATAAASANVVECEWTEEIDEKIAAAMGFTGEMAATANNNEEEADIVGLENEVYHSDTSRGDAHATFVGSDYHHRAISPFVAEHHNDIEEYQATTIGVPGNADANHQPTSIDSTQAIAHRGEEATVVAITQEEVHPADFDPGEAEAILDYTFPSSTPAQPNQRSPMTPRQCLDEQAPFVYNPNDMSNIVTPGEEATVVAITEEDVHPADFELGEAEATLDHTFPAAVPSDPPAVVASASFSSPSGDSADLQATIVTLPEDNGLVQNSMDAPSSATQFIPTEQPPMAATLVDPISANSDTTGVACEREATVVEITEDVHPVSLVENEARATLLERDYTTARSSRIGSAGRPVSAPTLPVENPFIEHSGTRTSPALSAEALAALDADEERRWLDIAPASVTDESGNPNIPMIRPPSMAQTQYVEHQNNLPFLNQDIPGIRSEEVFPASAAELLGPSRSLDQYDQVIPGVPAPSAPTESREASSTSAASNVVSEGDYTSTRSMPRPNLQALSNMAIRSTRGVMDQLLKTKASKGVSAPESIFPRMHLPWSVFQNNSTGMWVATVNTNQKALESNNTAEASRALKAFSVTTEREAKEIAQQMSPPTMLAFTNNPVCFICSAKFGVFRRACHCRNCGIVMCANCSTTWPSKMIPNTYNIKNETCVNVCTSCDWLSTAFRTALLNGQHDEAVALYSTGNVNLGTPFANVKGELFYPVHCAILGGKLSVLKWLVEEHFCSLWYSQRKNKRPGTSQVPILTSKGRSLLTIALAQNDVDCARYLVVEKGYSIFDEQKGMSMTTAILMLEAALNRIPPSDSEETFIENNREMTNARSIDRQSSDTFDREVATEILRSEQGGETVESTLHNFCGNSADLLDDVSETRDDTCIICYDNTIDCVLTPCGHQICCMQCSSNMSTCPVCTVPCSSMRVYKP